MSEESCLKGYLRRPNKIGGKVANRLQFVGEYARYATTLSGKEVVAPIGRLQLIVLVLLQVPNIGKYPMAGPFQFSVVGTSPGVVITVRACGG